MSSGFLKDVLKYLPAQVAPGIVGLVSIPVVTHIFPPAEYGDYNLAMATVMVLSTLFGWLPTAVIRYYPAYARQGQLRVFNVTVVSVGAIALALLTALYYVPLLALKPWISGHLWLLLILGGLLFVATCVFNLLQYILRSRLLVGRYSAFTVWQSLSGFGLSIALIFLLGMGIESLLLGAALSIVLILPLMWRQSVDSGTRIRLRSIDSQATRAMFAYGLPLAVGNLASWVLALSDRYILGWLRDSSEVGVYSLSHNIADRSLMLLTTLFIMASGPRGMHIWENEGEQDSERFVTHVTRFYLLLCVPATVGLSVLSKLVVDVLAGTDYGAGYRIMPWVLFGVLLLGLQQRYQSGLLFHRRTSLITLATVIAGVLNVLLNILFVPRYGYFAAGVTTPVSYAVLLLLTAWFARPLFTWRFPYRSGLNAALASGVMGAALYAMGRIPTLAPAALLVISLFAGAAIYGGVLLLAGEFSPQELAAVRHAARGMLTVKHGVAEATQPP
jgi:O-antigen/teichoic acid export membrane protein